MANNFLIEQSLVLVTTIRLTTVHGLCQIDAEYQQIPHVKSKLSICPSLCFLEETVCVTPWTVPRFWVGIVRANDCHP